MFKIQSNKANDLNKFNKILNQYCLNSFRHFFIIRIVKLIINISKNENSPKLL